MNEEDDVEGDGARDGGGDGAGDDDVDGYSVVYLSSEAGNGGHRGDEGHGFLGGRLPEPMQGGVGLQRLERRRRQLRRQLAGARVDIEKDVERSEMSAEDAEAVLDDVDFVLDVLERDSDARDYLEAVERSRDAVDRLAKQSTYLGISLGLAGLLLRFRVTAQFAALPVAAYLLYLLFRNVQTLRSAVGEGRHVVAVRVPEDAVPGDAELIPFDAVRQADAVDRAVEKAARADDDLEWTSKAIDLGGAKDMDDVVSVFSAFERADDGSYYVQHRDHVVAVTLVGEERGVEIEIEIE